MDVSRYDLDCQRALHAALQLARHHGHAFLEAEHVAHSLLSQGAVRLEDANYHDILEIITQQLEKTPKIYGLKRIAFGKRLSRALDRVEELFPTRSITPPALWEEVVKESTLLQVMLHGSLQSREEKLQTAPLREQARVKGPEPRDAPKSNDPKEPVKKSEPKEAPAPKPNSNGPSRSSSKKLKAIEAFTIDLSEAAAQGKLTPVFGRKQELQRVLQILGRHKKNNPLLVGEPGVGKSALAEGLAWMLLKEPTSEVLRGMRVLALDVGALLAGTKYRGEFEDRMRQLLEVTADEPGRYIFFIDEIHMIIGAGNQEGGADLANLLKPALARGTFRCLGATTLTEYKRSIQTDPALARRFQTVLIEEPSPQQALEILKGLRYTYETHHRVSISDATLEAAIELSTRYLPSQKLPDKAIDLVDEAGSLENLRQSTIVSPASLLKVIQERLNISMPQLGLSDHGRFLQLEKRLGKLVFGQSGAVKRLAQAIRRARSGISDPKHPWGSFLFFGPPSVGKQHTAKTLSQDLFGDQKKLIHIDLSEYTEQASVSRLIGAPPGFAGFEEGGYLCDAMIHQPFSVVFFDHVDQAHESVQNLLIQLLENGRLTDRLGRIADFSHSVVIFAISTQESHKAIWSESGSPSTWDQIMEWSESHDEGALRQKIGLLTKPALVSRLDEIVLFRRLSSSHLHRILAKELAELNTRLQSRRMRVRIGAQLADGLVSQSKKSGPSGLRRLFTKRVLDSLAEKILLEPKLTEGAWVLELAEGGEVTWSPDYVERGYLAS